MPPGGALVRALAENQVSPAEAVEVELAESQNGVVETVLDRDGDASEEVVSHDAIVVGGS